LPGWLDKTLRGIAKATRILFKKEYTTKYSLLLSWYFGRTLRKKMKEGQYDCIVAPAASTELAFIPAGVPIIFISDTTFRQISHYYAIDFANVSSFSLWEGNYIETRCLHKSRHVVYSSTWAASSAMGDYGVPKEKVTVMPLGANIDTVPDRSIIFDKKGNKTLTLLFLAVDWERKGGSIAFETLAELEKGGIEAKLIVCGCTPPVSFVHPRMEVIPFLNKNIPADHDRFIALLSSVHFLLLPTRADCSSLVACEANAYGVPSITTATGGVPDIVLDGINGYCLPYDAGGDAYARIIRSIYRDQERFDRLILSSRDRYEQHLNWDKWAEGFLRIYQEELKLADVQTS
jgi:glycosyltransferase involved in cell wall biosynthesis